MVDDQGRLLHGDHIMYALAMTDPRAHEGVVGTIMSNQGLENALTSNGIKLQRADVGDRYVLQGLRETGWRLGGEQSGHIVLPEYLGTGDGMLAAIRTIQQVRQSGRSLAEWRDEVPLFPQELVNIVVRDKNLLHDEAAQELIAAHNELLGDAGRLLVRKSGTEQKIRVMVEADNALELAPRIASELSDIFAKAA
jgi:phosphoglucosamine mutase